MPTADTLEQAGQQVVAGIRGSGGKRLSAHLEELLRPLERRVGVPEVVEPDLRDAGLFHARRERSREARRMDRRAVLSGEHEAVLILVVAGSRREALLECPGPVRA
ncbi:MAG TPA: hypothetical protein VFF07_06165 [Actinomycetota bacterium]|nr:hypothetical protein [Actinomycetota bacterium]